MASVQSVLVLGSIALAQVLPCLVQLSLVMFVLYRDFINVEYSEKNTCTATQAVFWSHTARANVKKITGPSTRPSAKYVEI